MPHLIIEYAAPLAEDINIQDLVEAVFTGAVQSGLFNTKAIKARAHACDNYWVGGTKQAFVHVEIKLLPGRNNDQKKDLTQRVFDQVSAHVKDDVAISVELNDLDANCYTKHS
ncbi:MAG: 5-carboxymethyl-2-hydroxymuconate isomerase [Rhodospirillaceae bacterium]|nr:MAG: 5-carboxymethyl-2-hydroxymuconate isomerase [Rhodospirillaceae bacterium]